MCSNIPKCIVLLQLETLMRYYDLDFVDKQEYLICNVSAITS